VSTDHQCIVWCLQVVTHSAAALLEAASGEGALRTSGGHRHRLSVLQRHFPTLVSSSVELPWRIRLAQRTLFFLPALPALIAARLCSALSGKQVWKGSIALFSGALRETGHCARSHPLFAVLCALSAGSQAAPHNRVAAALGSVVASGIAAQAAPLFLGVAVALRRQCSGTSPLHHHICVRRDLSFSGRVLRAPLSWFVCLPWPHV
jgi:hypothetical protein